jgi:hypothetical protein
VVLTDRDELDFFCPPKVLVELTPKFETTDGAEPVDPGRTSRNRVSVALRYADEHLEGVSRNLDQFARRDAQQSYLAGAFSCASALFVLLMTGACGQAADERDKFLYFVAAITFLAGFSERRAQDILVRASPLGGADKPSEQTASPPPR